MRISVIMPSYCQAAYIDQSIRSVLGQSDADFELIVYDALSSDGTPKVLESYQSNERVSVYREPDNGQVAALNKGLSRAKGDILCWLNSDDLFLPNALSRVLSAFESDPNLGFVYGDALEVDGKGRISSPNIFTESPDERRYLSSHNYICQPTCFFRREVWEEVGPINKKMQWTFDYDLFGRFFSKGIKGKRINAFLAANRHYPETKTNSGLFSRYCEIVKMVFSRSGISIWKQKALILYAFELCLKWFEQWKEYESGVRRSFADRYLIPMHIRFHRFVGPKERTAIELRFNELIQSERWENVSDWLKDRSKGNQFTLSP